MSNRFCHDPEFAVDFKTPKLPPDVAFYIALAIFLTAVIIYLWQ